MQDVNVLQLFDEEVRFDLKKRVTRVSHASMMPQKIQSYPSWRNTLPTGKSEKETGQSTWFKSFLGEPDDLAEKPHILSGPPTKKEIACTRSFGHLVIELRHVAEAITEFASRASEKLRKQHSLANQVLMFIRTSPFRLEPHYSRSVVVPLLRPTSDTGDLVASALMDLRAIYRSGFKLAKAGVMLLELQDSSYEQIELKLEYYETADRSKLVTALDVVNQRSGSGSLHMASAGMAGDKQVWSMKQERRTPGYTTRWKDILKCGLRLICQPGDHTVKNVCYKDKALVVDVEQQLQTGR